MGRKIEKIGVCGGTFDPIHNGHLIIAESLREQFKLDKVLFIPSKNPPHKNVSFITDAEFRLNMVDCAIMNNEFFDSSRIEIDRDGTTYTIDTLKELKEIYGEDVRIYFICGADVLMDLRNWKKPEEVFKICEFIVGFRTGFNIEDINNEMEYLTNELGAKIHIVETLYIEISSTLVRERINKKLSIKYLVPNEVEKYIINSKLYI